jgi:aspartyl-tRNA(Asn)/glutamyl-tRNA(Gln) amidotransferase subunit A
MTDTAAEMTRGFRDGKWTALELTQRYLDRIASQDSSIHAFLSVEPERALGDAKRVDEKRAAGQPLGLLAGVPVAVKDLICTANWVTTCGSKMLESYRPPYNATVVEKLQTADAILIGKTNLDEFAMGSSTEHSAFGRTHNPWDLDRVAGGSSGGAAACIAGSMAPLSLGTDTGGSIRQPAAFCGVVGLKPTYGRVSRSGLIAFASSLDQIGPLAWTAEDTALLLEAIAGHDPADSTSARRAVPSYSQELSQPLKGLRVGVIEDHFENGLDPEIHKSIQSIIDWLKDAGATTTPIRLPHSKLGIATYYVVASSEASSNLARYDGAHYGFRSSAAEAGERLEAMYEISRSEGFGDEVKRRIMLGTYALSSGYYDAYYLNALKVRRLIRDDFQNAFQNVDVLIGPTTPTPAFRAGEKATDPLSMYLEDIYTVLANLAGIPAIAFPCGRTQGGLPISAQLWGPAFEEGRLLQIVHQFQSHSDWHKQRPSFS